MMRGCGGVVDPSEVGAALHDRSAVGADQLAAAPREPVGVAHLTPLVTVSLGRTGRARRA